jgi:ribose transport system permease protein
VTTMETTPAAQPQRTSAEDRSARLARLLAGAWIYLALLIVIVGFSIWGGTDFLAIGNFKDVLYNSSAIALLAIGSAFLIIAGQLDLSLGSVLVFSSVVGGKVMGALSGTAAQHATGVYPHATRGIVAGIIVCVICGAAWGLFNGLVVTRWHMPSFIVTLGTMGMALGLAEVITKGTNVSTIPPQIQSAIGSRDIAGIPLLVIVSALIALVAGIMLAKTRFGLSTYAIGSNNEGARRAGLGVERHLLKLFVLAGTLAGLAGAYDVARFNTTSVAGHTTDALTAIAAVVIGGASLFGGSGTIALTAVGVLIPAVLDNGFVIVDVQPFWADVAIGAVLIIAVGIDQARRRSIATRR